MTPVKLLILRVVMLTVGRIFANLIRKLLQKMLITGKKNAPFRFKRILRWENGRWHVTDLQAASSLNVITVGIGCDQTSIYVVRSRTFQLGQSQPWLDLTQEVRKLAPSEPLQLKRHL